MACDCGACAEWWGLCAEPFQGGAKTLFLLLPLSVLLVLLPGLAPGGFLRNKLPTELPFSLPTEIPFQEEGRTCALPAILSCVDRACNTLQSVQLLCGAKRRSNLWHAAGPCIIQHHIALLVSRGIASSAWPCLLQYHCKQPLCHQACIYKTPAFECCRQEAVHQLGGFIQACST